MSSRAAGVRSGGKTAVISAATPSEIDRLVLRHEPIAESVATVRHEVVDFAQCHQLARRGRGAGGHRGGNERRRARLPGDDSRPMRVVPCARPSALVVVVRDYGLAMQPNPESPGLGLGLSLIGSMAEEMNLDGPRADRRAVAPSPRARGRRGRVPHRDEASAAFKVFLPGPVRLVALSKKRGVKKSTCFGLDAASRRGCGRSLRTSSERLKLQAGSARIRLGEAGVTRLAVRTPRPSCGLDHGWARGSSLRRSRAGPRSPSIRCP